MWLDIEWVDGGEWIGRERDWPEWHLLADPYRLAEGPYLMAVYTDGSQVGPYPVVLPCLS